MFMVWLGFFLAGLCIVSSDDGENNRIGCADLQQKYQVC